MDMRSTILATCQNVAQAYRKPLAALVDDLPLQESGLDSLCLAVIVARLEDAFGFDPFDTDNDIRLPVTIGEFIAFYEAAGAYQAPASEAAHAPHRAAPG
jgi:acyl carrier protein